MTTDRRYDAKHELARLRAEAEELREQTARLAEAVTVACQAQAAAVRPPRKERHLRVVKVLLPAGIAAALWRALRSYWAQAAAAGAAVVAVPLVFSAAAGGPARLPAPGPARVLRQATAQPRRHQAQRHAAAVPAASSPAAVAGHSARPLPSPSPKSVLPPVPAPSPSPLPSALPSPVPSPSPCITVAVVRVCPPGFVRR
jgi:hypothetical protein